MYNLCLTFKNDTFCWLSYRWSKAKLCFINIEKKVSQSWQESNTSGRILFNLFMPEKFYRSTKENECLLVSHVISISTSWLRLVSIKCHKTLQDGYEEFSC